LLKGVTPRFFVVSAGRDPIDGDYLPDPEVIARVHSELPLATFLGTENACAVRPTNCDGHDILFIATPSVLRTFQVDRPAGDRQWVPVN
jgi:hypothetical protein